MVGFSYSGKAWALALGLAAAALASAGTTQAAASDADKNLDISFRKLDLTLYGQISPSCRVSGGADIDFGNALTGGIAKSGTFGLGCNVPFALTVTSTSGGLVHETMPNGQGPFVGRVPYAMRVRVPTTVAGGAGPDVGGTFRSDRLEKTFRSGGDAIAAGGGEIDFLTLAPGGAGPLAGEYTDTVTITIAAQ